MLCTYCSIEATFSFRSPYLPDRVGTGAGIVGVPVEAGEATTVGGTPGSDVGDAIAVGVAVAALSRWRRVTLLP